MSTENPQSKFTYPITVRFADTDLQGHVFFANYLTYMDEAFMAYLKELGHSWQALAEQGLEIMYVNSQCDFKGRAFFEDLLQVHTTISKVGNRSLTAQMDVVRGREDTLVASGSITGVVVDSESGKPTAVPDSLREAISGYQR